MVIYQTKVIQVFICNSVEYFWTNKKGKKIQRRIMSYIAKPIWISEGIK